MCCSTVLVLTNSFLFSLSGKLFISLSILYNRLARWSSLGSRSLLFSTLNILCQFLLAWNVSDEKSDDSVIVILLSSCFLLFKYLLYFVASRIFPLSLSLVILIMMYLGVDLFGSYLFGTLCTPWTCLSFSFTRLGKFLVISSSNRFLILCSLSSPPGIPMMHVVPNVS